VTAANPLLTKRRVSLRRVPPESQLPENSQENLDVRLDHAIEETVPTSDPISVTITKGPEPDRPDQGARFSSADDLQAQPDSRTQPSKY
jgi:hypothetical protein